MLWYGSNSHKTSVMICIHYDMFTSSYCLQLNVGKNSKAHARSACHCQLSLTWRTTNAYSSSSSSSSRGADLTGGHSCSGRRDPWEAGPWRPWKAKFWLAIYCKVLTGTWIEFVIYLNLKRVCWFGVLFFQNFNKEISYFLTDLL